MLFNRDDSYYMQQALQEAHAALDEGEVPIGAVIVKDEKVIARAHNRVEAVKDPTAHAEIIAIGAACNTLDDWRLDGSVIYVTLEPCPMCAGAIINSRIKKLVFAARDKRLGACGSVCSLLDRQLLNRKIEVKSGILSRESLSLIRGFFQMLRKSRKTE